MPVSRSLNKAILIGNLGADPEVRSTANGSRVATLSIATSRQWKNQAGEKQEKTEWHRVVFWNTKFSTLADIAERFCKKGDKVYVEGSIEYRSWQDREGQTRYTTEINGRELILLSGRGDGAEAFSAPQGGGRCSGAERQGRLRRLPRSAGRRRRRSAVLSREAGKGGGEEVGSTATSSPLPTIPASPLGRCQSSRRSPEFGGRVSG